MMNRLRRVSLSFLLMVLMAATSFAVLASTSVTAQGLTDESALSVPETTATEGVLANVNVDIDEKLDSALADKIKMSDGPFRVYVAVTDRTSVNTVLAANGLPAIRGVELPGLPTMRVMDLTSAQISALAACSGTMKIMTYEAPSYDESSVIRADPEEAPAEPPQVDDLDVDYVHGAVDAWMSGYTGNGVNIAVIDTGFDMAHPDLQDQQARYTSGPYAGWPIAYDDMAAAYWASEMIGGWVADTSYWAPDMGGYIEFDGQYYMVDALQDVYGSPIMSQSGVYHVGYHTDQNLAALFGSYAAVLVVDANIPGWYDTVYVDIDHDMSFDDEKACTMGDEISYYDFYDAGTGTENWDSWDGGDGYADLSGGMVYWISDGTYDLPGSDWLYGGWPWMTMPIPGSGEAVAFVGEFSYGQSHGTMTASAALAVPNTLGGMLGGMAPDAKLIAIPFTGDTISSWLFAIWGADGIPNSGDEANIVSNSYGWSDTAIDSGYDIMDMYAGYISTYLSGNTLWFWSTGNGGPGYGTAHSVTDFSSVHVGAGTTMQYRAELGMESTLAYSKWGDVIPFSNSGPTRQGKLNAEIIASGAYSMEPAPLNEGDYFGWVGDGSMHFQLGSGTSHATPTVAGGAALGFEAYYVASGGLWPDINLAKAKLMASADDMHNDPFKQGAGWLRADTYVQLMGALGGTETLAYLNEPAITKAALYPGFTYGQRNEMFANLLLPGESDATHILSTTNYDPMNPANVHVQSDLLLRTGSDEIKFTTTNAGNNWFDVTSLVPPTTDLLRVTMYMPFSEFDPNFDYASEVSYWLEAHDWVDINADGAGWNTTAAGELFRYTVDGSDSNYNQITVKDPILRTNDGLIIRVRPALGAAGVNITLQLDYYELQTFPWIQFRMLGDVTWTSSLDMIIPSWSTADWEVMVSIPGDAPIGSYAAAIYVSDGVRIQNVPVVINVAAPDFLFEFGGPSYFDTPYNNDINGVADKGWRFEVGDWRMFWAEPVGAPPSINANLVVTLNWTELPTDVNLHVLAPEWSGWPQWYSPYGNGLVETPIASSNEMYLGAGTFGVYTNTGRAQEVLGAKLGEWWWNQGLVDAPFEIVTRCPVMSGNASHDTISGYTTWIFMNDYQPLSIDLYAPQPGLVPLTGTVSAWYDMSVSAPVEVKGSGVGPFKRDYYPMEPVYQDFLSGDFVQDLANAMYTRYVMLDTGGMLTVEVNEVWGAPDIDMGVWYDVNMNGWPDGGEPYWYVGISGSSERLDLTGLAAGQYIIKVLGYTVTGYPGYFDMTVLTGVPGYVTATDLESPVDSGVHYFNVSYSVPAVVGVYEGYATFGFMGANDMYRIDFRITVVDVAPPVIENLDPADGAVLGTDSLFVSFQANDHAVFNSGINWGTLYISLDGIINLLDPEYSSWWVLDEWIYIDFYWPVKEGWHDLYFSVADNSGNYVWSATQFEVDTVMDYFTANFIDPNTGWTIANGATVALDYVNVSGYTAHDSYVSLETQNGWSYDTNADPWGYYEITDIWLEEGLNSMTLTATNLGDVNAWRSMSITKDTICSLVVLKPESPTASSDIELSGLTDRDASLEINGVWATVNPDGSWYATVTLAEGLNGLWVNATDSLGNMAQQMVEIVLDTTAPSLVILSPADGSDVSEPSVTLTGTTDVDATVMVNGVLAENNAGDWSAKIVLSEGWNTVVVTAEDELGNSVTQTISVEYIPPVYVTPEQLEAAMAENVSALQAQIDAANADIAALQSSLAENVSDLQAQIDALVAGLAALDSALLENVTDLQGQIDASNADIAALQAALAENVTLLQTEISAAFDDIDALETALGENVTELQGLIDDLDQAMGENVAELQSQIDAVLGNIASLRTDIADVQGNVTELQTSMDLNIAGLQDDMDALNHTIQGQLSDLEQMIHDNNQTTDDVQQQVNSANSFADMLMYLTLGLFVIAIILIAVAWVTISRKMGGGSSGGSAQSMDEVEGPSEADEEFEALKKEIKRDEL